MKKSIPTGIPANLSFPPHDRRANQRLRKMQACIGLVALLSLVFLSATAFGQSTNASLTGTVIDTSKAVLSGASVTAVNTETGVETKVAANSSGIYNFASLQPGTYSVTAEASGFQRMVMTDVRLRTATQNNLNFELAVAGTVTEVEVTATAESMVIEAGASTGSVIREEMVAQLPILTGSALDLVKYMGGVVTPPANTLTNPVFEMGNVTFAGVRAGDINITRDGVSVNEVRFDSGINSPNRINPELVGEFRMVLSPVDAELGRGAGQVQITTRSGSNAFHGSGVWNVQNTALDSNEWANKHQAQVQQPAWRNLNNYTLTLSGPIVQNRTFFFASWDHQIAITKRSVTTTVLTQCARKGVYRYLDGVISGNANMRDENVRIMDKYLGQWVNVPGVDVRRDMQAYSPNRPVVNLDGSVRETYTFREGNNLNPQVPKYNPDHPFFPEEEYAFDAGGLPAGSSPVYSGVTVTNKLMYESVLGPLSAADRAALASSAYNNCEGYNVPSSGRYGSGWDVYRNGLDRSPGQFVSGFNEMMPLPNDYTAGDGLNTAALRWTRRQDGDDTVYGAGDANRKAITVKIDHTVNSAHRLSGTYSYELAVSDDTGVTRAWPNGAAGSIDRRPQTFQVSLTSTLRPTMLNEFRVGLSRTRSYTKNPYDSDVYGGMVREKLEELLPANIYKIPVLASAGSAFPGSYGSFWGGAITSTWGGIDPRWSVVENLTWMKGSHSFKGGFEFRQNKSWQEANGNRGFTAINVMPMINGGVIDTRSPYGTNATREQGRMNGPFTGLYGYTWSGLSVYDATSDYTGRNLREYGGSSAKITDAYTLLTYLSGSVANIQQFFFSADAVNPRWNDPTKETSRVVDLRGRELHFFFKDDWKLTRDLTLNLGARWEYYGIPWEASGLAASVRNDVSGMYGISRDLKKWMENYETLKNHTVNYAANGTEQIFIGPNSANPDISAFNRDLNNIAPHVGFAWQLPWFGRGKTTLKGGYSISYTSVGSFDSIGNNLASQPGMTYDYTYAPNDQCPTKGGYAPNDCYIDFSNVPQYLPLNMAETGRLPIGAAGRRVTRENRAGAITIYDPGIRNPYVQNINLTVTRSLNNFLTLDVRYIGTLSRKQIGTLDLNTNNYFSNGLFEELRKLRAGGYDMKSLSDFPLLNSGIIPYKGDPSGVQTTASLYAYRSGGVLIDSLSGAEQLLYNQWDNISRGNFNGAVGALYTANFNSNLRDAGLRPALPPDESSGQVLRAGNAPDNLIRVNPQYDAVNITRNQGRSNYHSMQTQVNMRPVHGLSFQATWTWSRNLARGAVLDYREDSPYYWETEYGLSGQHRLHTFNVYGTYELPFGARGFFLRDASGYLKKAVEGWQLTWIGQAQTGTGMSLTGINTVWNTNRPVQVGAFDTKDVKMKWYDDGSTYPDGTPKQTGAHGTYFNKEYGWVRDPQCNDRGVVSQTATHVSSGASMPATCGNPVFFSTAALLALTEIIGYTDGPNGTKTPVYGEPIFRNALPGEIGNVNASNMITGPGMWSLDVAMSKSVEFMEGKRLEFRLDAQNIFNHARPSFGDPGANSSTMYGRVSGTANPNAALNDMWNRTYPFGYTNLKAGHRTFQAKLSLRF